MKRFASHIFASTPSVSPAPDLTLILAANKHFTRFSPTPLFVCQVGDGDGWVKEFYHFSSPRSSVSLSCNLFRRFLHHHYSRCSFMSDFFSKKGEEKSTLVVQWVTLDGNVRITQLGNSEITLMKMAFLSLFMSGSRSTGRQGRGVKPKQFLCSSWHIRRLKLPIFIIVCFSYANMHARHLTERFCYDSFDFVAVQKLPNSTLPWNYRKQSK